MKSLKLAIIAILLTATSIFAQNGAKTEPPIILKCEFQAGDLMVVYQSLNTVNISGKEVDAFISVQNTLKPKVETLVKNNAKIEDKVPMELELAIANNLYIFIERITIKGGDADKIVRFKSEIQASAKKYSESQKK